MWLTNNDTPEEDNRINEAEKIFQNVEFPTVTEDLKL